MILYKQDWGLQPAHVHVQTSNKSFIKMHHVLKSMGIENNAFFLALHQPELAEVDPRDYNSITPDIAAKIGIECKINPWYYLREIVRLPASGTAAIPFRLTRAALFIYWSFFNSVTSFTIQPRQTGKTITAMSLVDLLIYILYVNTRIRLYTHDSILVQGNVDKLKAIRDELPPYLVNLSAKDTENKEGIRYDALNNQYVTCIAPSSIARAFNVGRGDTVLVIHHDEMPFCRNLATSYPVLMNSKNAAMQNARENNIPFGDMITTTAGHLDSDEGAYAYNILRKSLRFTEKFYDLSSKPELDYLLRNGSKNNILYAEFSFRQLGLTKEWADDVIRQNNLEGDAIQRDLYNKWTTGGANPAVDAELLEKMDLYKDDPVEIKNVDNYLFRWYEKEEDVWASKDRFFAIGLDTSENINEDFTSVHMLDFADLSTVMTSKCNDEDLLKLGDYIARILIEHDNVILIPERKSTAAMLISVICSKLWKAGINPFTRIYNRVHQNRHETPYDKIDINSAYSTEGPTKKYLGYTTASSGENSRDSLYKLTMSRAIKLSYTGIKDKDLIAELKTLTVRNGRIDHLAGKHDDSVISWLLAAWFVLYGKNHQLYGIPNHLKLSRIAPEGASVDVNRAKRQRDLGIRLNALTGQIRATTDPAVRASLEHERNFTKAQLESLGPEVQTVSTVGDIQAQPDRPSVHDVVRELTQDQYNSDYYSRFERQVRDPFARNLFWD